MSGSARVYINLDIPPEVEKAIEQNGSQIAKMIADQARSSTAFKDVTGTLRKGIGSGKRGNTHVAYARAPHAHLVEYGHGGPHAAPAHPFLRPAKEKVIGEIK